MYACNVSGIFSVINVHSDFIPFSTQVVQACKTPNMTLNLFQEFQFTQFFFHKTLTFNRQTQKLCPVQCTPALSERENIIPLRHKEVFTVLCIYDNIFAIIVLNDSIDFKVCLKCTSD